MDRSQSFASTPTDYAPCSDSLSLRLPPSTGLTLPVTATRRLIMQKARRHIYCNAPTACRHTVSGTISLPSSGCFSPFPHGTGSLSVAEEYLGLEGGPPMFRQDFTCPALLKDNECSTCTGLSPATAGLSIPFHFIPHCHWPGPRSLATTCGVSVDVLSCRYLDVSVPCVRFLHPILFR